MDNTSRVYIKTDDQGRIIRCEGEYTLPSNLDGWVLIEEGPPLTQAVFDHYKALVELHRAGRYAEAVELMRGAVEAAEGDE